MSQQLPVVDGVTPPAPPAGPPAGGKLPEPQGPAPEVRRWKRLMLMVLAVVYGCYVVWALLLMALLPDPDGQLQSLVQIGTWSAIGAGLFFLAVGAIAIMRLTESEASPNVRTMALIRIGLVVVPGLIVSVAMPFMISREPTLGIDIVKPTTADAFVAPVAITFSVERAVQTLNNRGLRAILYKWDIDGDAKADEETVLPTLTAMYDRDGSYSATVSIQLSDGSTRVATRRLILQRAVFSVSPSPPIIDRPVVFSVANLVEDPAAIEEVLWDFDNDGKADESGKSPQATYTFFKLGSSTVTVTLRLTNKTQATYQRVIQIEEPQPPPFPVTVVTEPKYLISPPPFGVLFRVDTEEPLAQVQWTFGDGTKGEGARVAHTFDKQGDYAVYARIRSETGSVAEITTLVQVVEPLLLPDLAFEGMAILSDKIDGEVPLTLNIRPRTNVPFVEFMWEAPEATEIGSTEGTLQAIYRREGTYTLTLIAKDAENHVMRKIFTVSVKAASSFLSIAMDPETGMAPIRVKFDASETFIPGETITGFEWDYGDRSTPQFGGARAEHLYTTPGTYVVRLTVRTTSGKDFVTTKTLVVRAPLLAACILPSRTQGSTPFGVQFSSDCSAGDPIRYLWDFGDGAQSEEMDPIHVFEDPGTYNVTLTIYDATGRSNSQGVTITAK